MKSSKLNTTIQSTISVAIESGLFTSDKPITMIGTQMGISGFENSILTIIFFVIFIVS